MPRFHSIKNQRRECEMMDLQQALADARKTNLELKERLKELEAEAQELSAQLAEVITTKRNS